MARPANLPYTPGKITTTAHPTNNEQVQARCYYNDDNGKRREATASGKSEFAAKQALQRKVNAAQREHRGGDSTLAHDTKVAKALGAWLDYSERKRGRDGKRLAASTLDQYRGNVCRYVSVASCTHKRPCRGGSTIEHLTIGQVNNVARIEAWLSGIADEHGEGAAVAARKVLSGMLALAERRGAIVASVMHRVETPGASTGSTGDRKCADPDCDYDCGRRHLDTRRAFNPGDVRALFDAADQSAADIADLVAFLFGTGARIREALHCVSWDDVDLEARTVRIRGTKTAAADRTVMLSEDLFGVLAARADTWGTAGLVFGVTRYESKAGQPRDVNNVLRTLRRVLASAGLSWAGSHTFRRTVASWMDDNGSPLAEIASQLGHANTVVTTKYLARKVAPTRAASVMTHPPVERPGLAVVAG